MNDIAEPLAMHDPLAGQYAGFWVKTAAVIVDLALCAPFYYGFKILIGPKHSIFVEEAMWVIPVFIAYCLFFGSKWHATPGMRLLGFHICDTQGQPPSVGRAASWLIVSTLGLYVCFGGVLYMEWRFDLHAVVQLLTSCAEENMRLEDCAVEVEQLIGIPYETFSRMLVSSFGLALFLILIWALSVALAKDKSGFHNLICGTRFVKGRL